MAYAAAAEAATLQGVQKCCSPRITPIARHGESTAALIASLAALQPYLRGLHRANKTVLPVWRLSGRSWCCQM